MKDYVEFPNKKRMPIIGLGTWQADDPKELEAAVEKAVDVGYRHFDTAVHYKNEASLGRALKRCLDGGKVKREDLFIVTKLPCIGMRPERVEKFLKSSLAKLQLDYVDLYLVHWPFGVEYTTDDNVWPMKDGKVLIDPTTNIESVWKEIERQVDAGRAKSIGLSNFKPSQIDRVMKIARIPPVNHQFEIHLYFQNKEWVEASRRHGITVTAYGPLGSPGRQTYATKIDYEVPPLLKDPLVLELGKKYGKTPAQILLTFLVQQNIVIIPKSTNEGRLKQNIEVIQNETQSD